MVNTTEGEYSTGMNRSTIWILPKIPGFSIQIKSAPGLPFQMFRLMFRGKRGMNRKPSCSINSPTRRCNLLHYKCKKKQQQQQQLPVVVWTRNALKLKSIYINAWLGFHQRCICCLNRHIQDHLFYIIISMGGGLTRSINAAPNKWLFGIRRFSSLNQDPSKSIICVDI